MECHPLDRRQDATAWLQALHSWGPAFPLEERRPLSSDLSISCFLFNFPSFPWFTSPHSSHPIWHAQAFAFCNCISPWLYYEFHKSRGFCLSVQLCLKEGNRPWLSGKTLPNEQSSECVRESSQAPGGSSQTPCFLRLYQHQHTSSSPGWRTELKWWW